MKELGRSTAYDTHNTTSLIRTPQVSIRHLADGRSLPGGRVYTHTHTHTHTHTQRHTHTHIQSLTFKSLLNYTAHSALKTELLQSDLACEHTLDTDVFMNIVMDNWNKRLYKDCFVKLYVNNCHLFIYSRKRSP